ncbi:Gfo/Idh/MocA family oxidoreductase [Enterococcus hulanensis]|uniref:Gfo/Idh/MocA family oxidoreductase n=1 Tax=Enterococcus hulanensis TaxID=2559929 RepID=A0ABU3EU85_9ENTE|nr:Gfo/Idh/MocA family oxidoreductase [Enterococcus hulanensis]MDT2598409.1 Gfo/Idh/MocA family oxidoreductase [Enterococcus hulanensis]MDT2608086.1 Gfo/Idh/MocA family oxidoreductase [Enterococcus hulanensis]MDT2615381.1 Gfo/Idh/MocA family oxidoreductase [Enterococcus hulanensis]MDT2626648.1 Gfo/Idh/MocA family oxidoreductase [Enterococcus hulanensis]MDT2654453.1 Gfo/Idh/MocA family oxidoreductase [Enterococcus hulanensis]
MKLAIFGSGKIVQEFLPITQDLPEIEVKAILGTKRSQEKTEKIQAEYGIDASYTDIDECLKSAAFDTVYVAVPNHLHYSFARKALEAGKHVICEKPFTLKHAELLELEKIALEKDLVLVEAITNQYLKNYQGIKEASQNIGKLKIIECNYSQYSSRYDAFKEGTILPAFNPKMGGGALMDINIYNIHLVVGLLGKPQKVQYYANIEREIDTSGMLILDYGDVKVVCIGAKDSEATIRSTIQGTEGSVVVNGPTNTLESYTTESLSGEKATFDHKDHPHRMFDEFKLFSQVIADKDMSFVKQQLEHSKIVMEIVETAINDAGIVLG